MPQPIDINDFKERVSQLISGGIFDIPLLVKGPPGIGKSDAVEQVAQEHGVELKSLRIAQRDPQGLQGLPTLDEDEGVSRHLPPAELPQEEGPGILFLDEFLLAPPTMMQICQRLIYERKLGADYALPDRFLVVAAGNLLDDPRAQVNPLPAPTANRMAIFEVEPDLQSFRKYAIKEDLHPQILGFLGFRPNLLYREPGSGNQAFPTPRTWERASRLLKADLSIDCVVGEAAAAEFDAYREVESSMPGLDAILEGEDTRELPDEPSVQHAVVAGLAGRAESGLECFNAAAWLVREREAPDELVQLYFTLISSKLEERHAARQVLIENAMEDEDLRNFMSRASALGLEL